MQNFTKLIQYNFDELVKTSKLFRVNVSAELLWKTYLNSFPSDIFRQADSTKYNCAACKSFINRYGNIVGITSDMAIVSIFNVEIEGEYAMVAKNLTALVESATIEDVFIESFDNLKNIEVSREKYIHTGKCCQKTDSSFELGIPFNLKTFKEEESLNNCIANHQYTFHHLHLIVPKIMVNMTGDSVESIIAKFRDKKNVFAKGLQNIKLSTLQKVNELFKNKELYDGQSYWEKTKKLILKKIAYDKLPTTQKDNFAWAISYDNFDVYAYSQLIGELYKDLQESTIDLAVRTYNQRIDPVNYQKVTAFLSENEAKKQVKFLEENGYEKSFQRRFANINDININEIKHINKQTNPISIFSSVAQSVDTKSITAKTFDNIKSVSIKEFMEKIVPFKQNIQVYVDDTHLSKFMSLTTVIDNDAKPIFKWGNNFSATFKDNLAGESQIKKNVREKGGIVDSPFRVSLQWNDNEREYDASDLDLSIQETNGKKIAYNTEYVKRHSKYSPFGGQLDLDLISPQKGKIANENIYYNNTFLNKSKGNNYNVFVTCYSLNNSKGFNLEIELHGKTYKYAYNKSLRYKEIIHVAKIDGNHQITHLIPCTEDSNNLSTKVFGINTNTFQPVSMICLSPNYWQGADNNTGALYYYFILKNAKNEAQIRTFHLEHLKDDLRNTRRFLELFGDKYLAEPTDNQLSGIGFNATINSELIVKADNETIKIIF